MKPNPAPLDKILKRKVCGYRWSKHAHDWMTLEKTTTGLRVAYIKYDDNARWSLGYFTPDGNTQWPETSSLSFRQLIRLVEVLAMLGEIR